MKAVRVVLLVGLWLALGYPVSRWLAGEWLGNDYYSHGPLVPLVAAFFAWRLWVSRPVGLPQTPFVGAHPRGRPGGQVQGLPLLAVVMVLGAYLYALWRQAYFVAALALIALVTALAWYLLGPALVRRMAFPVAFLAFMVPLPFVEPLSVPLAQFTGAVAGASLRLFGVPVTVNGAQVSLPGAQLVVGAACSGLRSVVALLTLVAVWVFIVQGSRWARLVLALSSLPIAAMGNILRVASLLVVANAWGTDIAFRYYHNYSGFVFFFAALASLLLFSWVAGCRSIRADIW